MILISYEVECDGNCADEGLCEAQFEYTPHHYTWEDVTGLNRQLEQRGWKTRVDGMSGQLTVRCFCPLHADEAQ